jgi:hypothetical protein
VIDI